MSIRNHHHCIKILKFLNFNLGVLAYEFFYSEHYPEAIKEHFTPQQHEQYNLRNTLSLTYNVPQLIKCYKKPTIAATLMWNKIPTDFNEVYRFTILQHCNPDYLDIAENRWIHGLWTLEPGG